MYPTGTTVPPGTLETQGVPPAAHLLRMFPEPSEGDAAGGIGRRISEIPLALWRFAFRLSGAVPARRGLGIAVRVPRRLQPPADRRGPATAVGSRGEAPVRFSPGLPGYRNSGPPRAPCDPNRKLPVELPIAWSIAPPDVLQI